ncbi:hypothetical protein PoB_006679200 [Plakobranchus ocellatus]|uniref:Uncharacterized protein n=1 Tax=Plakobranchus ocellatus TaxID=259542 RepID=A0AAV4D815_9GAST|nr:hypothetical protein PoB_006679200 [Plakobranchus ocellatus]
MLPRALKVLNLAKCNHVIKIDYTDSKNFHCRAHLDLAEAESATVKRRPLENRGGCGGGNQKETAVCPERCCSNVTFTQQYSHQPRILLRYCSATIQRR